MYKEYLQVRDNEVDIQGVVNNANYFIYMAHARHNFLNEIGINFAELAKQNQMLFLINSNIDFKKPLKPNDKFYVTCRVIPGSGVRVVFEQEIRHAESEVLIAKAINTCVCMDGNTGRPYIIEQIKRLLEL